MEEIINNIMQSPENTNPNVLRSQLQNIGGSGGGAVYATFTEDKGTWTCDKTYDELKAAYDLGSIIFGCVMGGIVFPMLFVTYGGTSGFVGTATLADGSPTITALYYYRLSIQDNDTVFVREAVKEFLT